MAGAQVIVDLYPDGPGYVDADDRSIESCHKTKTDANGDVALSLIPNTEIIPGGTVYRVRDYPQPGKIRTHFIDVPAGGGPYWLGDILSDPPGALTPAALTRHIEDPADAHDARAVSYDPSISLLSATDVQAAIDELAESLTRVAWKTNLGLYSMPPYLLVQWDEATILKGTGLTIIHYNIIGEQDGFSVTSDGAGWWMMTVYGLVSSVADPSLAGIMSAVDTAVSHAPRTEVRLEGSSSVPVLAAWPIYMEERAATTIPSFFYFDDPDASVTQASMTLVQLTQEERT